MRTSPMRVPLAHLPTPVEPLSRLSAELGLSLAVKRDDLTGSHLSGNKVRKLEYLLGEALDRGATHVLTCGGIQSNHARATALAGASLGLTPVLLLRTATGDPAEVPDPATGNVLLDALAGAAIRTCDPDGYRDRARLLKQVAEEVAAEGGRAYVVPEGGSDALGAWGYVMAAREIAEQCAGQLPTSVIVATGSGGTAAGLAMGFGRLGLGRAVRTIGIPVCDDAATFRAITRDISVEAARRFGTPVLQPEDLTLVDGYQGIGYALSTPDELRGLAEAARRDGLVLDPVYTVKAFLGLLDLARHRRELLGERPMFLHTGGIFGLFAAAESLRGALGPPSVRRAG